MDLTRQYITSNLKSLRGMISNDANHITLLYFLISSAKLLAMDIPTDTVTDWVLKQRLDCGFFTGGPAGC